MRKAGKLNNELRTHKRPIRQVVFFCYKFYNISKYNEILIQWQHITKDIGADIKVLDMELLDTRKKDGNLTGTLIADLVLQIFAYMAQKEREFILLRQAEGIAAAKARGIRLGRRIIKMPDGFENACEKCIDGRITTRQAAERIGISHTTFYRNYKSYLEQTVKESHAGKN